MTGAVKDGWKNWITVYDADLNSRVFKLGCLRTFYTTRGVDSTPRTGKTNASLHPWSYGSRYRAVVRSGTSLKSTVTHAVGVGDKRTYLSDRLKAAGELHLVDAVVHRFAVGGPLGHGAFTAAAANADTVDDVACGGGGGRGDIRTAAGALAELNPDRDSPCLAL